MLCAPVAMMMIIMKEVEAGDALLLLFKCRDYNEDVDDNHE